MRFARASLVLAFVAGLLSWTSPASAATSMSISWSLPSGLYAIGVDHVYANGSSTGGYEQFYEYPYSLYNNNPVMRSPLAVSSLTTLSQVRIEGYSRHPGANYDPLAGDGAVAIRVNASPSSQNIGQIRFPVPGQAGVGKFYGDVLTRSGAVANGRVRLEVFQTTGQQLTNTGYQLDAFSASNSVGGAYNSGPLWGGQYILYVTDTATGRQAIGFLDLAGNTRYDIDLDSPCFGIDECQWVGTIPSSPGAFHALSPTRIVDTRKSQGISLMVGPGDGRNADPNSFHRMDSRLNHEFRVTGVGGVPSTGVSAVLVNVTVTNGTQPGAMRLIPKPPRTGVWYDQSSYPTLNTQAPAVYWGIGETRASLQLVKVGVGGRIRIDSMSYGLVHVIVDVVGWVDESQPNQTGDRLLTVQPVRLLDTRNGTGGAQSPFGGTDTRLLQVTNTGNIPAGARGVIGNITSTATTNKTWQLVWPSGQAQPTASVLNSEPGLVRPNLVTAAVGSDGKWSIYNHVASTELIVDAVGYFTSAAGTSGKITAMASTTLLNQQNRAAGQEFAVQITGAGGVPASGVSAVFVLLTAKNQPNGSWMSAYPSGTTRPISSNLNWVAGQTVANVALVPVGPDGAIKLYTNGAATVSVDVLGWVS